MKISGDIRSEVAARVKKNRHINRLKNVILDKKMTKDDKKVAKKMTEE